MDQASTATSTVFIDRDGVINVNRPDHVTSWSAFAFLPEALPGLALLRRHGLSVIVITNQAIVNRGLVSRAELDRLHRMMISVVEAHGGRIDAVLVCPHRPEDGCGCRKPAPGLLFAAREQLSIDLGRSLVIGDHWNDLEAARRAGCRSMLVLSGRVPACPPSERPGGCVAVHPNLLAAACQIVAERPERAQASAGASERA